MNDITGRGDRLSKIANRTIRHIWSEQADSDKCKHRIKSKVEVLMDNQAAYVEHFQALIEEYFNLWGDEDTSEPEDYEEYMDWSELLWSIFYDIWECPTHYKDLYFTNMKNLESPKHLPEKLEKCIAAYVFDPENNNNFTNLQKNLEKYAELNWVEEPAYIALKNKIWLILEATTYYFYLMEEPMLNIGQKFIEMVNEQKKKNMEKEDSAS